METSTAEPLPHDPQALADAFRAFNDLSAQLAASYRELEARVAQLSAELAAARSERLRQLAEKERLAERLERLLEALPGGVVVLDREGVVREANAGALAFLGEPLVGEAWTAVCARAFTPASRGGEVVLRDGRQLSLSQRHLEADGGQIVLLQDVTDSRALQDLRARQERLGAMGEMAAALAHQIRTPLASALLYAAHLSRPDLGADDRRRFGTRLTERLRHLERLVNDMLAYARGGCFGVEELGAGDLARELRRVVEAQVLARRASLAIEDEAGGARVRGSRDALVGALANLVGNALEAGGDGTRVLVRFESTPSGGLRCQVRDDGPGIPEKLRERVFEPFFTTRAAGTGLGLAVVRAVVEAHGGRARAAAAPEGGALVEIELPPAGRALASGTDAMRMREEEVER